MKKVMPLFPTDLPIFPSDFWQKFVVKKRQLLILSHAIFMDTFFQ